MERVASRERVEHLIVLHDDDVEAHEMPEVVHVTDLIVPRLPDIETFSNLISFFVRFQYCGIVTLASPVSVSPSLFLVSFSCVFLTHFLRNKPFTSSWNVIASSS